LHIAIEKLTAKRTKRFRKIVRSGLSFPQADRILSKWKALVALRLDKLHWVYTDLGYDNLELESFMIYVKNDHREWSIFIACPVTTLTALIPFHDQQLVPLSL
jgi:hypothetical protein